MAERVFPNCPNAKLAKWCECCSYWRGQTKDTDRRLRDEIKKLEYALEQIRSVTLDTLD